MIKMERMLKESLEQAEQLLQNNQIAHSQALRKHSGELASLKSAIKILQNRTSDLERHMMRLTAVYESLQPLLTRLNALSLDK